MSDPAMLQQQSTDQESWLADTMRLSLFTGDDRKWDKLDLVSQLFSRTADMEQTSKRGNVTTRFEAARLGDFQINVMAQPMRLDVTIAVAQTPEEPDRLFVPIASFREFLDALTPSAAKLAPIMRIGVGASLIRVCPSKTDVYETLRSKFPCLDIDPSACDEFFLQMNRILTKDSHTINRIERWSYGKFERIDIPVMGGAAAFGRLAKRTEGLKLDLDFNTAPSASGFDATVTELLTKTLIDAIYEKVTTA